MSFVVVALVPRLFAQRARAAAASFALVAGEKNRPLAGEAAGPVGVWGAPRKREERRRCRLSICWRIEIASCRSLTDMSIPLDSRSCHVWQLVILSEFPALFLNVSLLAMP